MNAKHLQEHLVDYLYGEMDTAERSAFEQALREHPEVRQDLQTLQDTRQTLRDHLEDVEPPPAVSEQLLREAAAKAPQPRSGGIFERLQAALHWMTANPAVAAFATVLLVVGVSLFIYHEGGPDKIQPLATRSYRAAPEPPPSPTAAADKALSPAKEAPPEQQEASQRGGEEGGGGGWTADDREAADTVARSDEAESINKPARKRAHTVKRDVRARRLGARRRAKKIMPPTDELRGLFSERQPGKQPPKESQPRSDRSAHAESKARGGQWTPRPSSAGAPKQALGLSRRPQAKTSRRYVTPPPPAPSAARPPSVPSGPVLPQAAAEEDRAPADRRIERSAVRNQPAPGGAGAKAAPSRMPPRARSASKGKDIAAYNWIVMASKAVAANRCPQALQLFSRAAQRRPKFAGEIDRRLGRCRTLLTRQRARYAYLARTLERARAAKRAKSAPTRATGATKKGD